MSNINKKIYYNGKIFTSNLENYFADMMIIYGNKIRWIGKEKNYKKKKFNTDEYEKIDLKEKRIMPGFIDPHMHAIYLARDASKIACIPPKVKSIEELKERIKEKKKDLDKGEWIEGWGYDEGKLKEGRSPNRYDLDEVAKDYPVVITRTCNHIAVANSKALEILGIDENTSEPGENQIDKDENGKLTGIFREDAKIMLNSRMPSNSIEDDAEILANYSENLFAHGITTITDSMAETKPVDYYEMYQRAIDEGLKQRAILYYKWDDLKDGFSIDKSKKDLTSQLHVGGVKVLADGSVSGKTAWVNPSYLGEDDNFGLKTTTKKELLEAAQYAKQNNLQLVVHAMGEQAIDLVVNTFYNQKDWLDDRPSIRVEHASMPTKEALEKALKGNITFVSQPIFIYAEIESYLNNLGRERTKKNYPYKTILESGIKLAFSSDAPATAWADPVDPFTAIKSAVTRKAYDGTDTGQDEKIDLETAIRLYTKEGGGVTGIPKIGQLKAGYKADFLLLDKDIFEIETDKIDEVNVEKTYMNGKLVYKK
ncbi:MAG: amidohydrolase [Bacillota bacterium]